MNRTESRIHRALRQLSFLSDVHVVGGAVRDAVIGRNSDDIDVATSDRPETVKQKAEDRGWTVIDDVGIEHGTVSLMANDVEYEVTTFRRDVSCDGRNATVEFADNVTTDLRRRDFTINAMAARLDRRGELEIVDPFGGREDIEREAILAVGHALTRFQEDYLRVVRACRFAARYGFKIGHDERRTMTDIADRVTENVSVERIVMEIEKAFKDDNPARFLNDLIDLGIIQDAAGLNQESAMKLFDAKAIERARPKDRMTVFLTELSSTCLQDSEELQENLRLPNDLVSKANRVGTLLRFLETPIGERNRRYILGIYRDVLPTARRIGVEAKGLPHKRFEKPSVPLEPILSGEDLIEAGMDEGPEIGEALDEAHRIQLKEQITDKDELLQRVQ